MCYKDGIEFVKDVGTPLSYNLPSNGHKPTDGIEGLIWLFPKVITMSYILSTLLAHNKLIYLAFEVLLKFNILLFYSGSLRRGVGRL